MIGVIAGALAMAAVARVLLRSAPTVARLALPIPEPARFDPTNGGAIAISPDGTRVVYVASDGNLTQLFMRRLDDYAAVPVPGTEGGGSPFFSPDGEWIAFHSGGALRKVPLSGKGAITICRTTPLRGGAWARDDTIYFGLASGGPLMRVAASGGTPQPATHIVPGELLHRWPQLTPDGKMLVFTALTGTGFDTSTTVVQRLDTGERRLVFRGGTTARYVPSGHLVYVTTEGLFAVPFDLTTLRTTGTPVQVVDRVQASLSPLTTGGAEYVFSGNGTLVYMEGSAQTNDLSGVWMDRNGAEIPIVSMRGNYTAVALSPDDRRAALAVTDGTSSNIWIYDFQRATMNRLTFDDGTIPLWTHDGQRIAYRKVALASGRIQNPSSGFPYPAEVYWKRADGTGSEEPLTRDGQNTNHPHAPLGWAMNGRLLLMNVGSGGLAVLDVDTRTETPVTGLTGAANVRLSPDGKWISYIAGSGELYVQPFPSFAGRWQVSTGMATQSRWSRDGKEIFYRSVGAGVPAMMAVSVTTDGDAFHASKPLKLFSLPAVSNWDVSADGRRFLMLKRVDAVDVNSQLSVVTNWFEELKRLVPEP